MGFYHQDERDWAATIGTIFIGAVMIGCVGLAIFGALL